MNKPPPDFVTSFQHVAQSDVGMRRANNQDAYNVLLAEDQASWHSRGHLFMVADGMGAHAAGELASKLAADIIPHLYRHYRDQGAAEALRRAIIEANTEIHRRGLVNPDFHGMGTTASVLVLLPEGAIIGHVGDSRVYRLRDCRLEQLTFDHSLQWELRRHGRVAENSDLARSIPKNVITRSLGPHSEVSVDLEGPYSLQAGDTFLLCSDGLTGQVTDAELAELLAYLPPEEATSALIHLANLRGGADNTTVIVVKVVDDAVLADAPPDVTPGRAHLPASSLVCLPLAGVGLFVSLFLWLAEQAVPAAILALAGLGALIAAAVLWYRRRGEERAAVSTGEKLGSGPYTHHTFKHGDTIVRTLSSIFDQLREAATESRWNVPWEQVDDLRRQAEAAAAAHQFPEAVRQFAAAISFIMVELRRPRRKKGPDPGLEYRSR